MDNVSFVSNDVSVSLIIQGDEINKWHPAQQWQIDFLRPLAYDSQIFDVPTKTKNRRQEYVAFAPDLKKLPGNAMGEIDKLSPEEKTFSQSLLNDFNKQLPKENKSQLYEIGFLMNTKTRKMRLFAFLASSIANDTFLSPKSHVGN
jgi:hypothetical protein